MCHFVSVDKKRFLSILTHIFLAYFANAYCIEFLNIRSFCVNIIL
jgi:hypothetical protein